MYYLYFNTDEPYNKTDYGYWSGKEYTYEGDRYPICDTQIENVTPKSYSSLKRAFNAAKTAIRNYGYVKSVWILDESCKDIMLVTYESEYIKE